MKKILAVILDGFGYREEKHGNAIIEAKPETITEIWKKYPHALLDASEEAVGLLPGQFGNSEVGHMTIGAGRKIIQDIERINNFLDNEYQNNETFNSMLEDIKEHNKTVHLVGLFSDGKVHSSMEHFLKLFAILVENGITKINFHLITDGRDTKTTAAYSFIKQLEVKIKEYKVGKIVSLCGRYYAMDRDNKLDRTVKYYDLLTKGYGERITNIKDALNILYQKNITDEFIPPLSLNGEDYLKNGDVVIWMNYRTDRAKQILDPLVNPDYANFPTRKLPNIAVYTFVPIDKKIKTTTFLSDRVIENPLGIYLSKLGLTQARVAETEKYAHVTYFFDGEYDGPLENCNKYLIPSLKIKTYDLDPRMSAVEVTKKVIACMQKDTDFILVNFANPDMVGHTGNFDAAVKAVMTVDICLNKLLEEAENNFYKVIVTADHGNVDIMVDDEENIVTTHTLSKVPFILLDKNIKLKEHGNLTNIAPTILEYMDISIPKEMKETESLIIK